MTGFLFKQRPRAVSWGFPEKQVAWEIAAGRGARSLAHTCPSSPIRALGCHSWFTACICKIIHYWPGGRAGTCKGRMWLLFSQEVSGNSKEGNSHTHSWMQKIFQSMTVTFSSLFRIPWHSLPLGLGWSLQGHPPESSLRGQGSLPQHYQKHQWVLSLGNRMKLTSESKPRKAPLVSTWLPTCTSEIWRCASSCSAKQMRLRNACSFLARLSQPGNWCWRTTWPLVTASAPASLWVCSPQSLRSVPDLTLILWALFSYVSDIGFLFHLLFKSDGHEPLSLHPP